MARPSFELFLRVHDRFRFDNVRSVLLFQLLEAALALLHFASQAGARFPTARVFPSLWPAWCAPSSSGSAADHTEPLVSQPQQQPSRDTWTAAAGGECTRSKGTSSTSAQASADDPEGGGFAGA